MKSVDTAPLLLTSVCAGAARRQHEVHGQYARHPRTSALFPTNQHDATQCNRSGGKQHRYYPAQASAACGHACSMPTPHLVVGHFRHNHERRKGRPVGLRNVSPRQLPVGGVVVGGGGYGHLPHHNAPVQAIMQTLLAMLPPSKTFSTSGSRKLYVNTLPKSHSQPARHARSEPSRQGSSENANRRRAEPSSKDRARAPPACLLPALTWLWGSDDRHMRKL
jgi:hypothetical protein